MKREAAVNDPAITTKIDPLVPMTGRELVSVILSGLAIGVVTWILYYLLNTYIFSAVLCRPQAPADCSNAPSYAMTVSIIIASIAGLALLARMRVYRPLLVVLASAVSLWGFQHLTNGMQWYGALPVIALLFGFSYGLYTWLGRLRSFILAIVVTVVMVVAVRLALVG